LSFIHAWRDPLALLLAFPLALSVVLHLILSDPLLYIEQTFEELRFVESGEKFSFHYFS